MNLLLSLKNAFSSFLDNNVLMLAAALSYYTVFAIGPLLLIIISILGFFFERSAVEGEIFSQLSGLVGPQTAQTIEDIMKGAQDTGTGAISLIIGTLLLVVSASGVFGQLKLALNQIWNIEPKPGCGIVGLLRERIFSFGMVVVIAFLLGVSLIATSAVSVLATYFNQVLPAPEWLLQGINTFISFWVILVLFALVYRVLPDVKPQWKLIWSGATIAALLFTIGKTIIGIYIGNSATASTYGAASSLVILLLWVYYSSSIVFYGAEYVKVTAAQKGVSVPVEEYAVKTKAITQQDMTEEEEFSVIEQYIIQSVGQLFAKIAKNIDKKFFHREKSFWERVQDKL